MWVGCAVWHVAIGDRWNVRARAFTEHCTSHWRLLTCLFPSSHSHTHASQSTRIREFTVPACTYGAHIYCHCDGQPTKCVIFFLERTYLSIKQSTKVTEKKLFRRYFDALLLLFTCGMLFTLQMRNKQQDEATREK